MQSLANFVRLQDRDRLLERRWLQIQEQWNRNPLQIANAIRRFHWRAGQHAIAPRLLPQILRKYRPEFLQLIDVLRLATQSECQLTRLFEVAIVNFQTLDRLETFWEHVDHVGVELDPRDQNGEAGGCECCDAKPDEQASLRHDACDQITHPHNRHSVL